MISIANEGKTPGFIVLGMHRSGTSMLSGLLVEGFGYDTGGADMGGSYDNEKGFYERWDVVLQNDEFLRAQNAGWSWNVLDFNPEQASEQIEKGIVSFSAGKKALKFLNKRLKILPYIQKDPRMCITLPTWLHQLNEKPAIVFTYRHPLEVAMSLNRREQNYETEITIEHGLLLWITYNMRALQNSMGLCRVYSSNEAILVNPKKEVERIKNELVTKCNVIPPPIHEIPKKVVDSFVDPMLQHNKHDRGAKEQKSQQHVLKDFGGGCVARDFKSDYDERSAKRQAEVDMYLIAMRVFCDLESGHAYRDGYEWPDLGRLSNKFASPTHRPHPSR
ncbi:hypothetical protein ACHAXH_004167 [Discostella pseudostelligera]